ncbi:MAG: hypothetical protein ACFHU9_10320 [Fluviicola sp.]
MAISKKGLRKIVVENREFYWQFNEKVFVFSEEKKNSVLVIDFGWYDVWLYANDSTNKPPDFEPKVVTPDFVRSSILFALSHDWIDGKMQIEYRNGTFKKVK